MITLPKICSILQQTPLFQGMSIEELTCLIGQTKFDFLKYNEGKTIVKEGQLSTHLLFVLNGTIEIKSTADNNKYYLVEEFTSPCVIQPQSLFGINTRYTKSFKAKNKCNVLAISKTETLKLSDEYIIFKLNLLNILSTQAQKAQRMPWIHTPETLERRIAKFIKQRVIHPAGEKVIKIKMTTLAHELNASRRDISKSLHLMQQKGLLIITREKIKIPKVQNLINNL